MVCATCGSGCHDHTVCHLRPKPAPLTGEQPYSPWI